MSSSRRSAAPPAVQRHRRLVSETVLGLPRVDPGTNPLHHVFTGTSPTRGRLLAPMVPALFCLARIMHGGRHGAPGDTQHGLAGATPAPGDGRGHPDPL